MTNQTDLLREVAYDFWRTHFYEGEAFSALLALKNGITPETLLNDLDELTRNPTLRILPNDWRPLLEIVRDLNDALAQLRQSWAKEEKKLRALFAEGAWARHNHGKPEKILPLLDNLARCLSARGGTAGQLESIASFARRTIEDRVRKGFSTPQSSLFDGCDRFLDLEQDFNLAVRAEFFGWARTQLAERKLKRNVFSYDDLLTQLDAALAGTGGKELARSIREKYQAALIDEFQDTDPVQYPISPASMAGATRWSRSSAIRNRQSTPSAARTFSPTCRRQQRPRRRGNSRSPPTGARRRHSLGQ